MERFNSRTEEEKKERGSNLCTSIIVLAINIAEVIVGYTYLDDEDCKEECLCKLDAAKYLFYSGILGLAVSVISLFFTFCLGFMACCAAMDGKISKGEGCAIGMGCCLHWLIQLAVFVTQIVIVIWGFAVIFPAHSSWDYKDEASLTYCHYTPFMFAFVLLIIECVFLILAAPCILCMCCCGAKRIHAQEKSESKMDGCCESLVKYILVLFNFIFAITGMLLIGIGAYVKIQAEHYLDFVGTGYVNTPIFIIIVGVVIFVIAFFGCWGAYNENTCMIYTYAVILCVILIAEVAAGIAAFVLKNDLRTEVEKNMKHAMMNYGGDEAGGVTGTWDAVQRDLKCCGVSNSTDWAVKLPEKFTAGQTPDSCCKKTPEVVGCGKDDSAEKNKRGCLDVFETEFLSNIGIVGGVALGSAFIQAIGVCCACCIGKRNCDERGFYV